MEKARGGEWTAALRGPLSSSPKKAPPRPRSQLLVGPRAPTLRLSKEGVGMGDTVDLSAGSVLLPRRRLCNHRSPPTGLRRVSPHVT